MTTTTASRDVAVLSAHRVVTEAETTRSLEEMIFEVTSAALEAAGLDHASLDGVVLSGQDQTDGRVISCMTSAGPASGVDRDTTMIASSGEHALIYGWMRLLSGQGRNVLVVGWSKPSESVDPDRAELVSAEPFVLRPTGMNATIAAALQASRWTPPDTTVDDVVAWPLGVSDLPARADAVYAFVLTVGDAVGDRTPRAWIRGAGWSTEAYEFGSRDLATPTALLQAVERLGDAPGVTEWDTIEIAAPSEPAVRHVVDAIRVDPFAAVNPSGSLRESPAPPHVAGLGRMFAALDAVSAAPGPRVAAGIGLHGFAGQGATVLVVSNKRKG
ncbi:hypothetical protein ABZ468_31800 [Streptomyces sp. NPDC005708]|uniref:hypothetical protein n=1 Tax=Streptomyces sp. NPDC005708 TaxID=3154564 RepID=UPI0033FCBE46